MTTAFVLSGGASLGSIEVGMLQALIDRDIRPDFIVGTSAGAINGGWLSGASTSEDVRRLGDLWRGLTRNTVFPADLVIGFAGFLGKRNHLVSNRGIKKLLVDNLKFDRLEDAPIPLHVVAGDVLTGADKRFSTGDAVDAILASSAIPALLPPVVIDGVPYMDGGTVNNTPITHAVELGADRVYVLTTGSGCTLTEAPTSALGMGLRGLVLAINDRMALDIERYESKVDLRVVPPLCPHDVSPAEFGKADELITRAEKSTNEWLDALVPAEERRTGQAELLAPHAH
ncbi:patatin-like phospholipase family protein [Antrihabitans cavernicola]|uniref:Patatin-like phospholipase family protein n=1 Tax=Antrihabitans cavernicola TaxID=2495913 RepID=A0A5A7S8K4_9NOCA|nr:patatin-like phospholipase family protein [Spelaeibacter cavernicola]KAA0022488.1 patatin-like phospholipase family protein [Spelaeibacter cavernicola]